MKKTEIKRRKRVVPSLRDQSTATPGPSQSPFIQAQSSLHNLVDDSSMDLSALTNDSPIGSGRNGAPLAVDFTHYQPPVVQDNGAEPVARKRSASRTASAPTTQKMRRLAPKVPDTTTSQEHDNIDPSLDVTSHGSSSGGSVDSLKARLLSEMQGLRQLLAQKEKQFAALLTQERAPQTAQVQGTSLGGSPSAPNPDDTAMTNDESPMPTSGTGNETQISEGL